MNSPVNSTGTDEGVRGPGAIASEYDTPSAASRSIVGVSDDDESMKPQWSARRLSAVTMTMFCGSSATVTPPGSRATGAGLDAPADPRRLVAPFAVSFDARDHLREDELSVLVRALEIGLFDACVNPVREIVGNGKIGHR